MTPKQEAFALAYFETRNGGEAYRRAYDVSEDARDNWIYVEAWQLLGNPKVAKRLEALEAEAERLAIYTRQKAMEELEEARAEAKKQGQAAAMTGATVQKIKLTGLDRPQRHEVTGKDGGPIQTEEVSARERINSKLASLAARSGTGEDTSGAE